MRTNEKVSTTYILSVAFHLILLVGIITTACYYAIPEILNGGLKISVEDSLEWKGYYIPALLMIIGLSYWRLVIYITSLIGKIPNGRATYFWMSILIPLFVFLDNGNEWFQDHEMTMWFTLFFCLISVICWTWILIDKIISKIKEN